MSSKTLRRARPAAKGEERNLKKWEAQASQRELSHLGIWVRVMKSIRVKEWKG